MRAMGSWIRYWQANYKMMGYAIGAGPVEQGQEWMNGLTKAVRTMNWQVVSSDGRLMKTEKFGEKNQSLAMFEIVEQLVSSLGEEHYPS